MKRISLCGKKPQVLHIETPNGIINIRTRLTDCDGRSVDSIEIIPDAFAGEPKVTLDGYRNSRLIREKSED